MTRKTHTASSPKQRLFVGIKFTLYEEIQPAIIDVARTLTDKKVKFRMSPPQNLHLTLKFLGSVLESDLRKIDSIVSHTATRHHAMELHCAGIGFFKNSIWVGIKDNSLLTALTLELDQAFVPLGIYTERKARVPHVTVARFGTGAKIVLAPFREKYFSRDWGLIPVREMILYKSETLEEGAKYSIINSYKLGQ
tara:strand:- start:159 stop:740 length:582 start_codon:yes stop_codon:yes gene_type:complete